MGFSIAEEALKRGAKVTLISGPTHLQAVNPEIHYESVVSAAEMYEACKAVFKSADIIIMAAAVADYTPVNISGEKLKKKEETISLGLKRTHDILEELGKGKKKNQLLIGFALESGDGVQNAKKKLEQKNLDLVVLNSLDVKGAGFDVQTNKVKIIGRKGTLLETELKDKKEIAADILDVISNLLVQSKKA
jgi:phosphopantothenoylcysteine decarboxylase/phosphopantothenate--cysteine ligase